MAHRWSSLFPLTFVDLLCQPARVQPRANDGQFIRRVARGGRGHPDFPMGAANGLLDALDVAIHQRRLGQPLLARRDHQIADRHRGRGEREEKPNDGRALLNLGHTFGHALEAELGYGVVLHGEAVAVGIGLAFRLSASLGLCNAADAERVIGHFTALGLPGELSHLNRRLSADRLVGHMRRDKKMRDGQLAFVLARGIGQAFTKRDVPPEAVLSLLREQGCAV